MKAYKVFNPNWICHGFQYLCGKSYKFDGKIELRKAGFHACLKLSDCFSYYSFDPENKVAIVDCSGQIIQAEDNSKIVCSEITILEELSWQQVLDLANIGNRNTGFANTGNRNTGNRNTGDRNTGDNNTGNNNTGNYNTGNYNTGYCNPGYRNTGFANPGNYNTGGNNTGHRNTGDNNTDDNNIGNRNTGFANTGNYNTGNCNTGNKNTGNWNTGNYNTGNWNICDQQTGFFNRRSSEIIEVFEKPCKISDWEKAIKPNFLYFDLTEWISFSNMTDQEKLDHPEAETTNGYLKELDYKEAFQKSWDKASLEDRKMIEKLPNFSWEIFTGISGIQKPDDWD